MKILILGASGLVGNAVYDFFSKDNRYYVTGTYRNYFVNGMVHFDPFIGQCLFLLEKHWDLIIYCGSLTNVELCELQPQMSYQQNVDSTSIILNCVSKFNPKCHFIYLSTDYVFDGLSGPYLESDMPNPINVYGIHKLKSELLIINELPQYSIIRITNVFGFESRNKNFVTRLIHSCLSGGNLSIDLPFDQFATPIYAEDIARAIKLIFEMKYVGVIHLGGSDYLNRFQLGKKIISFLPECNINLNGVSTEFLCQAASRPLRGGLITKALYDLDPKFIFTSVESFIYKYLKYGI